MTDLIDAIDDCKNEILETGVANFDDIAADYGLNVELLKRKFNESFPNGVTKLANTADTIQSKVEKTISTLCQRYNVAKSNVYRAAQNGKTYFIIGQMRSKKFKYIAVSEVDGKSYTLKRSTPIKAIS